VLFRLVILNGPRRGERITVPIEPLVIGRAPTCGLVLDDPEVAAEHALLEHFQGGLLVRDLGTMNRILVNKREVVREILKHGDVLEIGRTQILVQAFVQAEVKGPPKDLVEIGSGGWGRVLGWASGLVVMGLFAIAGWRWWGAREAGGAKPFSPPKVPPPSPTTNLEPSIVVPPVVVEPSNVLTAVPTATAPTVVMPSGSPATEEELRRLREELATIKEAFQKLVTQTVVAASAPERVVTTWVSSPPPSPAHPPQPSELLAEARQRIEDGQWDAAEALLEKLQSQAPGFLPAYELRAMLYERRGQYDKALGQWALLYQQALGRPEAERAAGEWARLTAERRRSEGPAGQRVMVEDVSVQRFPDSSEYDEMRLLRLTLRARQTPPVEPSRLRVEILFFDEDLAGQGVVLTRAMTPTVVAHLALRWEADGTLAATAAYVVPAGFRKRWPSRFHGYIARVYCDGTLEDEVARPLDLLLRERAQTTAGPIAASRPNLRSP